VLRIGRIRANSVADGRKMVPERAPGIIEIRFQFHRSTQRRDSFIAAAGATEREAEFVIHREPAGLRVCKRLEHRECRGQVAATAPRNAEQELRDRMSRHGFQDLGRLVGRECGIGDQQFLGVRERDGQRADGLFRLVRFRAHGERMGAATAGRGWRQRIQK